MSRLSRSCLAFNLFAPDGEEKKRKRKKGIFFAHIPLPLMENAAGYNESQQWSLMKRQILISFQFRRRRALYYQAGLFFFFGKPLPFIQKGEWSPLRLRALFIRQLWCCCPHASANMSKERHAGRINIFFVNAALFNAQGIIMIMFSSWPGCVFGPSPSSRS